MKHPIGLLAKCRLAGLALLTGLVMPLGGFAQTGPYTFTNVVDTNTSTPDFGFFTGFSDFPGINNSGTVALRATTESSRFLLFSGPASGGGPYVQVASDDFSLEIAFDPLINDAGTVAFYAWEQDFSGLTNYSILSAPASGNGPFVRLASTGSGTFSDVFGPALNNSNTLAFIGTLSSGTEVLYTVPAGGGSFRKVVDTSAAFSYFLDFNLNLSGTMAFIGALHTGASGIFVASPNGSGPPVSVADTDHGFSQFQGPISINRSGKVVFHGTKNTGLTGIFTAPASGRGPVATVADSSGPFSDFIKTTSNLYFDHAEIALNDDGLAVFYANLTNGGFGLFAGPDPVANKIIAGGDPLFGSTVTQLACFNGSLNNFGQLVFYYELADGRSGVAVANPPPPTNEDINGQGSILGPHGNQPVFKIANVGNEHTTSGYYEGNFCYYDKRATLEICTSKITSVTTSGNHATFTGTGTISATRKTVNFTVTVTGNQNPTTKDTFSIKLSNGYTATGQLTSGSITLEP